MAEKIIDEASLKMYEQDQVKYSIIVNRRRAIPQVRDGLKPVQRRAIYGAYKDGLLSPKQKDKSASLVGTVMKKYHPHGDSSIYETIVNMVSWFKIKIPIFYGKGNWGNAKGDGAAAPRYTECALSDFGYNIFIEQLNQANNIINWIPTYKRNSDKEPEYLPVKAPILLINGSFGMGLGMIVSIPSHNLGEVIEATKILIKDPNADIVLVPDLCQSCELIGDENTWRDISNNGRGQFKARGRIITEQDKKGNYTLRVISLPDMVTTTSVCEKILQMVEDKQLPMIKDIYNALDEETEYPDIIINLRPGADPSYVKQVLYARTEIQRTIPVNFEAVDVDGINIRRFSYKDYLLTFIDQSMNIKFRLYCNKLQQVKTRHHYIDAFIKVLESGEIDNIIQMIKKSKGNDDEIMEHIVSKCKVTDIQAKFILQSNLSKLSMANLNKYKEERNKLEELDEMYMKIVTDDGSIIKQEIYKDLEEIQKRYSQPRLCNVIDISEENNIPSGIFKIVITEKNYIRKIPDVDKINVIRKDNPKFIMRVDNRENILIFDNKGKVFNLPVHKIPISDKTSPGTDIRILVKNLTSDIVAIFYEAMLKEISKSKMKHYFVIATKDNTIKRLDLEDFLTVNPSGLLYSKLLSNDEVVSVELAAHNLDVVVCSSNKVLRYNVKDIPLYKRNSIGAKAMGTNGNIHGVSIIYPDVSDMLVITNKGKFNRFDINMIKPSKRGNKGSSAIKLDSGDKIFNIYGVNNTDIIKLTTVDGTQFINVSDIKIKSPIAAGTKMVSSNIIRATIMKQQK